MENRLLNKELISELFEGEWYEIELRKHCENCIALANIMNIKISGVKGFIKIEVAFIEVDKIGLVLIGSEVIASHVNIGDVRQAAINTELITKLDHEKYYLPNWLTPNKYILVNHSFECHSYRNYHHAGYYFCIEKTEPELLLEAMADFASQSNSLARTQLVLHDGKIYSRLLASNEMIVTNEEMCTYANEHLCLNSSCIVDYSGNVYTLYKTGIKDLNNIRLLTKDWINQRKTAPINMYSDECYTYREFAALNGQEMSEELPVIYSKEYEGEKHSLENGYYQKTPYRERIEIKIFSPRIIGDELVHFQNGDHVQHIKSLEYGIITDSSGENNGIYQFQTEKNYEYLVGKNRYFDLAHASQLKKVEKPLQENIGRIAIYITGDRHNGPECVCMGEIIHSLYEYYVVKIPTFSHDVTDNERTTCFSYQVIPKTNCYYLKKEYLYHYEKFRKQSEQMEWIKSHTILGTYLYPLLESMSSSTLMPYPDNLGIHFDAFMMYLEFQLTIKTPEQIYKNVIKYISSNYTSLKSISLNGLYDIPAELGKYFVKYPDEE